MPPKPQKNGLTYYIEKTLLPELRGQGRVFPNGIRDVIPIAIPKYKALSKQEQQRYEQMAKKNRNNPNRRDNTGAVIADRRDPRDVMMQKRREDRQIMKNQFLSTPDLLEEKFYVIGFEYMIEYETGLESVEYYPVEVGLVEWTMNHGITNALHFMINPGPIPLGYRFKCQEHGEETHKIPLDKIAEGDSNYLGMWIKMENFVQAENNKRIVHCLEHEHPKISGCLTWLHQRSQSGGYNRFEVRFLEDLAAELFARENKNVSESSILDMLTTSAFDYEPNTSCKFHHEAEVKSCALGTAKRYTFALSDSLSSIYNFDLTANHVPTRNTATNPYCVMVGPNQEQLIAESRKQTPSAPSRTPSAPIRDYPPAEGTFASRDIRFINSRSYSGATRPTAEQDDNNDDEDDDDDDNDNDDDVNVDLSSIPSEATGVRYANTAPKAPPVNKVPLPTFNSVPDQLASLSLGGKSPITSPPRPNLPGVARGGGSPMGQQLKSPPPQVPTFVQQQATSSSVQSSCYISACGDYDDNDDDDHSPPIKSPPRPAPVGIMPPRPPTASGRGFGIVSYAGSVSGESSEHGPGRSLESSQRASTFPGSLTANFGTVPVMPVCGRGAGLSYGAGRGLLDAGGIRPPPGFAAGRGGFF